VAQAHRETQEDHKGTRVNEDSKVSFEVSRDGKVMGSRDGKVILDLLVQDSKASKDLKVFRDSRELKAFRDSRELKAFRDLKVFRDSRELKVFRDSRELKASRDTRVLKVFKVGKVI